MNSLDFVDDDRRPLSQEFLDGTDYSDLYLRGTERIKPETPEADISSVAEAEQAITATIKFVAAEGSKTMDSTQLAVVLKGLSDLRALITTGDVIHDNTPTEEQKTEEHSESHDDEQGAEKAPEKPDSKSGGSGGNMPSSKPVTKPEAVNTPEDKTEESNLKKLMKMAESNISWPQTHRDMDPGQEAYLAKLKGMVKGFASLQELVVFLIKYVSEGHGRLTNSMFVFLLILYLSDVSERYMNMFLLSPVEYYESPLTKTRAYDYDVMISMLEKATA